MSNNPIIVLLVLLSLVACSDGNPGLERKPSISRCPIPLPTSLLPNHEERDNRSDVAEWSLFVRGWWHSVDLQRDDELQFFVLSRRKYLPRVQWDGRC